jgi:arylsulfatase A-like enzyme
MKGLKSMKEDRSSTVLVSVPSVLRGGIDAHFCPVRAGLRLAAGAVVLILWTMVAAGALAAADAAPPGPQARDPKAPQGPPNILFILVDTLRADHLGCYGYGRDTSPALDRLAAEGALFRHCVAASSWTMPSVMTIFTSLHPSQHGVTDSGRCLPEGVTTLAAELQKAGYQTVGFTTNPMVHSKFGYGQGFEFFDDFTLLLTTDLDLFQGGEEQMGASGCVTSPMVNRFAIDWLQKRRNPGKPFFLFLLYFDPHGDYVPPPPYDTLFNPGYTGKEQGRDIHRRAPGADIPEEARRQIVALYDGEIRHTDAHIGKVLAALDDQGLRSNTMVVVVADHGEELWDHGGMIHGHTLYEELVHVPCIIRWPGVVPPGSTVESQVAHLDLMPTLLGAIGAPAPSQCMGRSFLPLLRDPAASFAPAVAFMENSCGGKHNQKAVRAGPAKIIQDLLAGTTLCFDLLSDPGERSPLPTPPPDSFVALGQRMAEWLAQMQVAQEAVSRRDTPRPQLDQNHLNRLKALGYMQ